MPKLGIRVSLPAGVRVTYDPKTACLDVHDGHLHVVAEGPERELAARQDVELDLASMSENHTVADGHGGLVPQADELAGFRADGHDDLIPTTSVGPLSRGAGTAIKLEVRDA